MPVEVGPDGHVSGKANTDHALHALLNTYLRTQGQRHAAGDLGAPDLAPFKKALSKPQLVALISTVLDRIAWIEANAVPRGRDWQRHLIALLERLYTQKLPYTEADLCALLRATANLSGVIPPYGPVEQLVAFTRTRPLTGQLCEELRNLQASLTEEMSINQTMAQLLRQRLHMLLWLNEWDELEPKRCWSEAIRGAYRAMSGARREKWRALLYNIRGDAGTKPSASWSKEAQTLLAAVGIDDVRVRFTAWLASIRGEPLPLSVAGSHVLKGMLWYMTLVRDPVLNEAALCLVGAQWKPKRNAEKCTTALIGLLETMPPELAREPMARLEQALAGNRLRTLQSDAPNPIAKVLQQVVAFGPSPGGDHQGSQRALGDMLRDLGSLMGNLRKPSP